MSEGSSTNRDFIPVENPLEALTLLRQGVRQKASATVWSKGQEKIFNTHLADLDETGRKLHVWIPQGLTPRDFLKEVAEKGHKDWLFSVSLTTANLFFSSQFLTLNEAGIVFRFPDKLFKVQRRKDFRLLIPTGQILRVEFDDPLLAPQKLRKNCLDISAGGLSFVVDSHELPLFQVGATLRNVAFSVRGHKVQCDGEIRHARDLPEGSFPTGSKIGIQFANILPGDAQKIARYVFEETRKFVSKFL